MGVVYKVRQRELGRFAALKILPNGKRRDPAFAERFSREARALAALNHPNIVSIYDFGQKAGLFYFIMEYVDGLNLSQVLTTSKIAPAEALAIVPQICDALQYAHNQGIVHRDIKPENILLDKSGKVKIADFGLAKITGQPTPDAGLTVTGEVMGTPHYMAPEQVEHPQEVDHRADIYSLGVVFYQMLTGELPMGHFAPPSRKVQIDVRLDEVVLRALEKEPALRYQQAGEVKTQVEMITGTPLPGVGGTSGPAPKPLVGALPINHPAPVAAEWNPWQPVLALVGVVWGAVFFPLGFILPFPFNVMLFVVSAIVITVAGLKLAGLWPWPSPLFPKSNWTGRNLAANQAATAGSAAPTVPSSNYPGALVFAVIVLGIMVLLKFMAVFVNGPQALAGAVLSGLLLLGLACRQKWAYCVTMAYPVYAILAVAHVNYLGGMLVLFLDALVCIPVFLCTDSFFPKNEKHRSIWLWSTVGAAVLAGILAILLPPSPSLSKIFGGWPKTWDAKGPVYNPSGVNAIQPNGSNLQQVGIYQDAGGEFRKDSSQTFPLNADGRFSLDNVNGRIEIHGWNNNAIAINSVIHGRTSESVEAVRINIDSKPDRVIVHTEQPSKTTGSSWGWPWFENDNASVDYAITVPQRARLADIRSVNGNITINGVSGDIAASTVNGETQIKDTTGNLSLSTVNGRIAADVSLLGAGQSVSLNTVNGELQLAVPENADANFSASTVNGGISSEFPSLQVKKEFPVGSDLNGVLGNGGATVKATSVNGSITIMKNQMSKQIPANTPAESPVTNGLVSDASEKPQPTSTNIGVPAAAENPAILAAQAWLTLIDNGSYSEGWKGASTIFRGGVTEPSFSNSMETFRRPLGDLVSRKLKLAEHLTELPGAPDGQYVVMQFETSFANKKSSIETVTFVLEKDGQWKSAGYYIK
ncbi:MAG: DUF4019 domain-containing protein [Methylacidiphilales bacterium]|nr:DUF4019 domain-containing protein [Candidatus Methylacidiphilales bacterium]